MPKRSLILAGGGLKVAFQAGALQVLLDEAGLKFDHADGASGGCFNLAMYCQGYSGQKIADKWREYEPFLGVGVNLDGPGQFAHQLSYFTMDNFRKNVLPKWGIDWNTIRAGRLGTFNLFNFSKKRLEVTPNSQMDEDKLIASVSLPMWFPPVVLNGDKYIDAVYITDANVQEAINRGADELWAIWTVSTRDEWRPGFVAQYFHIIETVADTNFFTMWDRIKKNNDEIAAGRPGEFGRTITQRLIQAEVPVHYLFNYSRDQMAQAVNQGVQAAREFCKQLGLPLQAPAPTPQPGPAPAKTSLQFTEDMRGFVGKGTDFQTGFDAGKAQKTKLDVHLTIRTEDVDEFVTNPQHQSPITGTVDSPFLGGKVNVDRGVFNLFVSDADPRKKEMRYRLFVKHTDGSQYTVVGAKHIQDDKSQPEVWEDTTTLYTTVYKGTVEAGQETGATQAAIGIIHIGLFDFMRQLTTFRVQGPNVGAQIRAIAQFGNLFLGSLMQVYGGFLMPD